MFYVATLSASQLLLFSGFALVGNDTEILMQFALRRRLTWGADASIIMEPLDTHFAEPSIPVNRDAILVHPLQVRRSPLAMSWTYIPVNRLPQSEQARVSLAGGTQRFLSLDEDTQTPVPQSRSVADRVAASSGHSRTITGTPFPADALRYAFPSPEEVDGSTHSVQWSPDGTPVFPVDPGDPQGSRTAVWPYAVEEQRGLREPEPTKIQDHRARKVRIRRGDSDV